MQGLRAALTTLVDQLDDPLPDYVLPNAAQSGRVEFITSTRSNMRGEQQDLAVLLSKALTAFTLHYEAESPVSLVLAMNVLRPIGLDSVALRDLPRRAGVARETLKVMTGYLRRQQLVGDGGDRKTVSLTSKGWQALDEHFKRVSDLEAQWLVPFGPGLLGALRRQLELLVGDVDLSRSPLARAIASLATGWRARNPLPQTLPHHPVVSHRGGYPDGS